MWENPATVRNVAQLKADGKVIIEPTTGFLAEGYNGKGRLPEPEEIFEQVTFFENRRLYGSPLKREICFNYGWRNERTYRSGALYLQ